MSDRVRMTFDHFGITTLFFNVNSDYKPVSKITINPEIAGKNEYNGNSHKLKVFLKVSLNSGNLPFYFTLEGFGMFAFDGEPDEQTLKSVSSINAPAIIFPYIRETIADLTRRAGFPPLHLQPINFVKLAERQSATPQKAIIEKKRSTKKIK